jgi:hypothetical protein
LSFTTTSNRFNNYFGRYQYVISRAAGSGDMDGMADFTFHAPTAVVEYYDTETPVNSFQLLLTVDIDKMELALPTKLYDISPCEGPKTFEDWRDEGLAIMSLDKLHVALHHPGPKMQIEAQLHNLQVAVKDGGFLGLPLLNLEAYVLHGPRFKGLRPMYAWNIGGHVGRLHGALSLEMTTQLVHFLQCYSFHAQDLDNFFPPPPSEVTPIAKAAEAATKRKSRPNFLSRAFGTHAHPDDRRDSQGSMSPTQLAGEWPAYSALPHHLVQHRQSNESREGRQMRAGSLDSSAALGLHDMRVGAGRGAARISAPEIPRVLSRISTSSGTILIHESVTVPDDAEAYENEARADEVAPAGGGRTMAIGNADSWAQNASSSPAAAGRSRSSSASGTAGRQRALTAAPAFRVWSTPPLSPGARRRRAKTHSAAELVASHPATEEESSSRASPRTRLRMSRRSPKLGKSKSKLVEEAQPPPVPLASEGGGDVQPSSDEFEDEEEEAAPNFVFGTLDIELESLDVLLSVDSATACRVVVSSGAGMALAGLSSPCFFSQPTVFVPAPLFFFLFFIYTCFCFSASFIFALSLGAARRCRDLRFMDSTKVARHLDIQS